MKLQLRSKYIGSASLKALAEGLSTKLGYKVLRTRKVNVNRKQLQYGTKTSCKIKQYVWFEQNNIPALPFTTKQEEAKEWLEGGEVLFARTITRGSSGKGIVILEKNMPFVLAPVYTIYRKKKREFRVHIFQDKVVHILEKRKRTDWADTRETKIRNLANGYVFCSENIEEPEGLRALALKASKVSESDFKGVDIGYNQKKNELFVIEVNSCPGIQGSNIDKYINAILHDYL